MDDLNKFIETYSQEAEELLNEIEETVLEIEESPDNADAINRLFRAFHTIKGSGSMFGFNEIADFTHHVETILDMVRNGMLPVTKGLNDLMLKAKDHIEWILACRRNGEPVDIGKGQCIISDLNKLILKDQPCVNESIAYESDDRETQQKMPEKTYRICIRPSRGLFANGTDPSLLLDEIRALGECRVTPLLKDIPSLYDLDPEGCYLAWDIILTTQEHVDRIKDIFIFVEDECGVDIDLIDIEDESLDELPTKRLGEILVDRNDISEDKLNDVLHRQKRIGEMLVESGLADRQKIDSALVEQGHINNIKERRREGKSASCIRVASSKLDTLVDLVGELVTMEARLSRISSTIDNSDLISVVEEAERLTGELRDNTMSIRMMQIGTTFSKFKRLVRDLSRELGKEIELVTEGADTELDKTVIERLDDPLVHLIRNCIDHGIEPTEVRVAAGKPAVGKILLSARHSGANVLIEINDDGAGLDRESIYLKAVEKGILPANADLPDKDIFDCIFAPGFSTAQRVTNVSGRGVGMDVVRKSIDELRGTIEIKSIKNSGTSILIKLPLTLVIIEGLLVEIGQEQFVLPISIVRECVELSREDNNKNRGRDIANIRGDIVPYIRLRNEFEIHASPPELEQIVVTGTNGSRIGFVVDRVIGEHQTVIKNLGKFFRDVKGISGATILGDGKIALIIDTQKLVENRETLNPEGQLTAPAMTAGDS